MQRCERKEPPTPPPQQPPSEGDQLEPFRPEHCMLPSETGPCRALQPKYYYDSRVGVCDVFGYGGCGGNQNKFDTGEECEARCGNVQDLCGLPPVRGRCQENVTRYYYDARSDQCLTFEYSGCRGNRNVSQSQLLIRNIRLHLISILSLFGIDTFVFRTSIRNEIVQINVSGSVSGNQNKQQHHLILAMY